MTIDRPRAEKAVEELLTALGHPPSSDPELTRTGQLVAHAWSSDLLSGYALDPKAILGETLPSTSSDVVALRNIETCVICPHHLLPAPGSVHLTYAPGDAIVGLGAISGSSRPTHLRFIPWGWRFAGSLPAGQVWR